ncbi:class I SAM-dependent methyltransferase [Chloroflexota bacterium]
MMKKLLLAIINPRKWRTIYIMSSRFLRNIIKYGTFSANPNSKRYWNKKLSRFGNFWIDTSYRYILDLFPQDKFFSLLDIGCAIGDGCELMQKEFPEARITGVDISEIGIDKAKRKTKSVEYFVLDILKDQVPGKYDYITLIQTLEHFEDPFYVVDKCLRHVNSSLIIMTPYIPGVPSERLGGFWEHRYAFNEITFTNYNCKVTRITEYIKGPNKQCIIYEILP